MTTLEHGDSAESICPVYNRGGCNSIFSFPLSKDCANTRRQCHL